MTKLLMAVECIVAGVFSCSGMTAESIATPVKGHVHASTLLPLKGEGEYLAAWFEGTKESAPDVAIRGARRIGGAWEPVRTFAKVNPESPHWNPVLRRADDGHIELFFKVGRNCADWRTYVQESRDEGLTWSKARELVVGDVSGGRGPVKNKCIRLKSGRWLAPASREFDPAACWELKTLWRAFVDISDDDGRTWRTSPPFPVPSDAPPQDKKPFGVIQPTLWEDVDGVHALMRATDGWIWRSDSVNGGETWCVCRRTSLENINSGIDCVLASDGRLYLVLNGPSRDRKKKRGYRNHLEVVASGDGGATWKTVATLADDGFFQPDGRKTEFSYPAIIEPRPGVLAISFTWNRRQIRFVEISCKVAAAR